MRCRISYYLNSLKFNSEHFVTSVLQEKNFQMHYPEQDNKIEDARYIPCTLNVSGG